MQLGFYQQPKRSSSVMCPTEFLTNFAAKFVLPQEQPWHNVQPPSDLWSNVISTLRGQKLPLRRWTTRLDQRHGGTGHDMPKNVTSIPGCGTNPSQPSRPTSLPLPPGFDLASSGTQSKLDIKLWRKPSVMWRKPCFWPDTTIHEGRTDPKSSTCPSGTCSKPTKTRILRHNRN